MAVKTKNDQLTAHESTERSDALRVPLSRLLALRWETLVFVVILLAAIFTRFYMLGDRAMSHDESLHVYYSYKLYTEGDFDHTPLMHGPILFHMTALSYALFGDNDFTGRIYTSVLGVIFVLTPFLFRRWIGKWGAILASTMFLISPLLMYYNRYIREDTPAILSSVLMVWAIFMYLNGPQNQRRRVHWLYVIAASMVWNLGSKETAFFYIGFTGLFLMLYWFVRMAQQAYQIPGKPLFYGIAIGTLLAGFASLGMYIILDVAPLENIALQTPLLQWYAGMVQGSGLMSRLLWIGALTLLIAIMIGLSAIMVGVVFGVSRLIQKRLDVPYIGAIIFFVGAVALAVMGFSFLESFLNVLPVGDVRSFFSWSMLVGVISSTVLFGTLYWALRGTTANIPWVTIVMIFVVIIVVLTGFIVVEELSHVGRGEIGLSEQAAPGTEGEVVVTGSFSATPIIAVWVLSIILIGGLLFSRSAGWWTWLHHFPELDIMMTMGALILPWLTAIFTVAARGTPDEYTSIALGLPQFIRDAIPVSGTTQAGQVIIGFITWLPLFVVATLAGLIWNWKRFIVTTLIFHGIFAFFFTTVFTNINGLATGMVYSLQYWLEQQAERRGNQPQYYYLMIIMPIYEYLPIIGSGLAMLSGVTIYWKRHLQHREMKHQAASAAMAEAMRDDTSAPNELAERVRHQQAEDDYVTLESQEFEAINLDENGDALPESANARQPYMRKLKNFNTLKDRSHWTPYLRARNLTEVPFLLFVSWWAVLNLIIFTLAGEKMPWLGTHLTTPMILLTAWYFGGVIERINVKALLYRGWIYLLLVPLLFVALFQVIAPPIAGETPFSGVQQHQLTWTYNWITAVVVLAIIIGAIIYLLRFTGVRHFWHMFAVGVFAVLAVITFRAAWMASFVNYDYATEFLVYAHGTPGTKIVMDQIEEYSKRTTDGMNIKFAYDDRMNWPGVWYFREYPQAIYMASNPTLQAMEQADIVLVGEGNRSIVEPLLEDRYVRFDYKRMWWPIMDYFDLNPTRLNNTFDLSPINTQAAALRRGLFDIWWSRDYTRYGQSLGRTITIENWPVSENMSMYVSRELAEKVWNYGTGPATAAAQEPQEVSLCVTNWQELSASVVFDTSSVSLLNPVGVDVHDGRVYVAEVGANRISVFDEDGNYLESFGQRGTIDQVGAFFERPNSIAVANDGTIYVVDTWNYRIRSFSPDLDAQATWGSPITIGINAPEQPYDGFWGPRDAAVDSQGNVYVTDTGNKRVRVYSSDGQWLRDIGSGGSGPGQLDEPSGVAIHPDGRVFVADTWNRRISVFLPDGTPLTTFSLRAWYEELGNRPYIAIDAERDYLYITDPDAGRIMVYNTAGECLGAFGRLNRENPGSSQFNTIGGIDVDGQGNVFVSDIATGRVLRFDPFPAPVIESENPEAVEPESTVEVEAPEE